MTSTHPEQPPGMNSTPASSVGVTLRGVTMRFETQRDEGAQKPVLQDLDIDIPAGSLVALVGASGCGKSTALRLIAGLLEPTSGSVEYSCSTEVPVATDLDAVSTTAGRGVSMDGMANSMQGKIGFVFQHPTLLPWRSALANVTLPLELHGMSAEEAMALGTEAFRLVKLLPEDTEKLPRMLSGGMQMRVSMARALVTRPSLMLLDEPFAAIDDLLRHQLNDDLLGIWQARRWTGVFVTHHLAEAVYVSQRVFVVAGSPGRVVGSIPIPLEYPRRHAMRSTAEFTQLVAALDRMLRAHQSGNDAVSDVRVNSHAVSGR